MTLDSKPIRLPRFAVVVLALVLAVACFMVWQLFKPVSDPRVDALRKRGYPMTLAELDESYRRPSERENAAFIYTNIFALRAFSNAATDFSRRKWPDRGQKIPPDELAAMTRLLATNDEALRLFQAAAKISSARYPIDLRDGSSILLPHLARIKEAAIFLSDAALIQDQEGEKTEAVEALEECGQLADSLSDEPVLLSQLVRYACWAIVCSRVERILNLERMQEEQLARLQRLVAGADNPDSLKRGLSGELACGYAWFISSKQQAELVRDSHSLNTGPNWKDKMSAGVAFGFLKVTGVFATDRAYYLDTMATNLTNAEQPYPERFKANQRAMGAAPPGRFLIFSRILLPALSKSTLRNAEHTARVRVTATALAVERFRRANTNALPADLGQLVPSFLAAVPTDPFDGQPLRFKKAGEGYVVYSIGSDGHDDGGLERDPNSQNGLYDVTFVMEK